MASRKRIVSLQELLEAERDGELLKLVVRIRAQRDNSNLQKFNSLPNDLRDLFFGRAREVQNGCPSLREKYGEAPTNESDQNRLKSYRKKLIAAVMEKKRDQTKRKQKRVQGTPERRKAKKRSREHNPREQATPERRQANKRSRDKRKRDAQKRADEIQSAKQQLQNATDPLRGLAEPGAGRERWTLESARAAVENVVSREIDGVDGLIASYDHAVLLALDGKIDGARRRLGLIRAAFDTQHPQGLREKLTLDEGTDNFPREWSIVLPHVFALSGCLELRTARTPSLEGERRQRAPKLFRRALDLDSHQERRQRAAKEAAVFFERALDLDPGNLVLCRTFSAPTVWVLYAEALELCRSLNSDHRVAGFAPDAVLAYPYPHPFVLVAAAARGSTQLERDWRRRADPTTSLDDGRLGALVAREAIEGSLEEAAAAARICDERVRSNFSSGGFLHDIRSGSRYRLIGGIREAVECRLLHPPTELRLYEQGVRSTALLFNPISTARALMVARAFQDSTDVNRYERSGTCASCGAKVPAALSDSGTISGDAEPEDLYDALLRNHHLLELNADNWERLRVRYLHSKVCNRGLDSEYLTHLPLVVNSDAEDARLIQEHFPTVVMKARQARSRQDIGHGRGGGPAQAFLIDEIVTVRISAPSGHPRLVSNYTNKVDVEWNGKDVYGLVRAIHPSRSGGQPRYTVLLSVRTELEIPDTLTKCDCGRGCPFRLMYHGFYGYRGHENERAHNEGGMYILLDNRTWRKGTYDAHGIRESKYDVDAWVLADDGTPRYMRTCQHCYRGIFSASGEPYEMCIRRLQFQCVPCAKIDSNAVEQYHPPPADVHVAPKPLNRIVLLDWPSHAVRQSISPVATTQTVHRAISSSRQDSILRAKGVDPSKMHSHDAPMPYAADDDSAVQLQRVLKHHSISFAIDPDRLLQLIRSRKLPGPRSLLETARHWKVVIASPRYSHKQLMDYLEKCFYFDFDPVLAEDWLRLLVACCEPSFYADPENPVDVTIVGKDLEPGALASSIGELVLLGKEAGVLTRRAQAEIEASSGGPTKTINDAGGGIVSSSGVVGVNMADAEPERMMQAAASNLVAKMRSEEVRARSEAGAAQTTTRVAIIRDREPFVDFHESQAMIARHPLIFPNGSGTPSCTARTDQYTLLKWARHVLGELSCRVAAEDVSFAFDVCRTHQRHIALKNARLVLHKPSLQHFDVKPEMITSAVLGDFAKRIANGETPLSLMRQHPEHAMLLNLLTAVGARDPADPHYRKMLSEYFRAMVVTDGKGPPTVWDTKNFDEYSARILHIISGFDLKTVDGLTPKQRAILVARDPFALVQWFDAFQRASIECHTGISLGETSGPNAYCTTRHRGMHGIATDLINVAECAQRGGEHGHTQEYTLEGRAQKRICDHKPMRDMLAPLMLSFNDSIVTACAHGVVVTKEEIVVLQGEEVLVPIYERLQEMVGEDGSLDLDNINVMRTDPFTGELLSKSLRPIECPKLPSDDDNRMEIDGVPKEPTRLELEREPAFGALARDRGFAVLQKLTEARRSGGEEAFVQGLGPLAKHAALALVGAGALTVEKQLHGKRLKKDDRFVRSCHRGCFKSKWAKQNAKCRFDFGPNGRLTIKMTTYKKDGTVAFERNFEHIVLFTVGTTLGIRCNSCVELIFFGLEAYALFIYIKSYQLKGELTTHNVFSICARAQLMRETHQEHKEGARAERASDIVGRFVMQLQGSVDMPAALMAAHLLGIKLEIITKKHNNMYVNRFSSLARKALGSKSDGRDLDTNDGGETTMEILVEFGTLASLERVGDAVSCDKTPWSDGLLDLLENRFPEFMVVALDPEGDAIVTGEQRKWCLQHLDEGVAFVVCKDVVSLCSKSGPGVVLLCTDDRHLVDTWTDAGGACITLDGLDDVDSALASIRALASDYDTDGVNSGHGERDGADDDGLAEAGTLETDGAGSATIVTPLHDYFFRCRHNDADGSCPDDGAELRRLSAYNFHRLVYKVPQSRRGKVYTVPHPHAPQRNVFFRRFTPNFRRIVAFTGSIPKPTDPKEELAMFYMLVFYPYPPPKNGCTKLDADAMRDALLKKPGDGTGYFDSYCDAYNNWQDSERLASDPLWFETTTAGREADAIDRWRHPVLVETWRIFDGVDRATRMRRQLARETQTVNERRNLLSTRDPELAGVLDEERESGMHLRLISYDPKPRPSRSSQHVATVLNHYEPITTTALSRLRRAGVSRGGGEPDDTPMLDCSLGIGTDKSDEQVAADVKALETMHNEILFGATSTPSCDEAAEPRVATSDATPVCSRQVLEVPDVTLRFAADELAAYDPVARVPVCRLIPPTRGLSNDDEFLLQLLELAVLRTCYGTQAFMLWIRAKRFVAAKHARDNPDTPYVTPKGWLLIGEPGCGKTHVQHTWTELLKLRGEDSKQAIGAMCGQAAVGVGGQTIHSLVGIRGIGSDRKKKTQRGSSDARAKANAGSTSKANARLERFKKKWAHSVELFFEELFAVRSDLFYTCSERLVKLRGPLAESKFFGGLLVNGSGDPYQMAWSGQELYGSRVHESARVRTSCSATESANRRAVSREVYFDVFGDGADVAFADRQKRAASDDDESAILRFMLRLLRNGAPEWAEAMQATLYRYCGIWNLSDEERRGLALTPVGSTRHAVLDRVNNEIHPKLWAAEHNVLPIVVERFDELLHYKDDDGNYLQAPLWMKNFMRAHAAKLTQNDTQRMAFEFPFVKGYEYNLWDSMHSATGTVTHATMIARGINLKPTAAAYDGTSDVRRVSVRDVRSMTFELKRSAMDGRCIGSLPTGHFTLVPVTHSWTLDIENIDKSWYRARSVVGDVKSLYHIRSTGIRARSSAGKTMWCIQGVNLLRLLLDLCPPPTGSGMDAATPLVLLSRCTSLRGNVVLQKFPAHVLAKRPSKALDNEIKRLRDLERRTIQRHRDEIERMYALLTELETAMEAILQTDAGLAVPFVPRAAGDDRPLSARERWRLAYEHIPSLKADLVDLRKGKAPSRRCSVCHSWSPQANIVEQRTLGQDVLCFNCKALVDTHRMPLSCEQCKVIFVPSSQARTRGDPRSRRCSRCIEASPEPSTSDSSTPSGATNGATVVDDGAASVPTSYSPVASSPWQPSPSRRVCAPHVTDDTSRASLPKEVVSENTVQDSRLSWDTFSASHLRVRALRNLGNTCYINAGLSALSFVPPFSRGVLAHPSVTPTCSSEQLMEDLRVHLSWLHGSGGDQNAHCRIARLTTSPKDDGLWSGLGFAHSEQADAHELLEALLYKLDGATTLAADLFDGYGIMRTSRAHGRQCRCVTTEVQKFRVLALDLPRRSRRVRLSIETLLAQLTADERMDRRNLVACSVHAGLHPATRKFIIARAPRVLTILLKRFRNGGMKDDRHVTLPEQLDLTSFMTDADQTVGAHLYSLTSVIVHAGAQTVTSGHYYTYVRGPQGEWFLSDCSRPGRVSSPVSVRDVVADQAYVAIYTHLPPSI